MYFFKIIPGVNITIGRLQLPYPNFIYFISITYLLPLFYSLLLVVMWRSSGKSGSQQEIKTIYISTLRKMCTVLISVL